MSIYQFYWTVIYCQYLEEKNGRYAVIVHKGRLWNACFVCVFCHNQWQRSFCKILSPPSNHRLDTSNLKIFNPPPPVDSKTDETMLPQAKMKKIYQNVKAQKSLKNCKIQKFPQKFQSFTPRVARAWKFEIFWKFLNFAIF